MTRRLYLGLDVGTTGVKAIVFDAGGTAHGRGSASFGLHSPRPATFLQDANEWRAGITRAVRTACDTVRADEICAVAVSAQGGALVPVDEAVQPIGPARSWLDRRASSAAATFAREFGAAGFYQRTGWPIAPNNTAAQLLDLRHSEPDTFARASYFCDTAAFINGWLTGSPVIDTNVAGITQLMNVTSQSWDADILPVVGVDAARLPELMRPGSAIGNLRPEAADQLGLPADVLVAAGAHDQYCASLGGGAVRDDDVLLSTGTAWVMLAVADAAHPDPGAGIGSGRHLVPRRWGHFGEVPTGGVCLEWARRLLDPTEGPRPALTEVSELVKSVEPGADGLSFYPHFDGTSPYEHGASSCGSLLGLSLAHGPAHLFRAVMEGVTMSARLLIETYERGASREPAAPVIVGGATRSSEWMHLVADVLNREIRVATEPDTACAGAAILAALAAGDMPSIEHGVAQMASPTRTQKPDAGAANKYERLYAGHRRQARTLTDLYAAEEGKQ